MNIVTRSMEYVLSSNNKVSCIEILVNSEDVVASCLAITAGD